MDLAGVNKITKKKEAVNPSSLFQAQRHTVPRLMTAQKAFDSEKQSFMFVFIVRHIITFSDAWTVIWMDVVHD